jgi:neurofibromin 1
MATRMLTTFARQQGAEYLRTTLQFVLEDLFARGGQMRFELDPTKANPGEDISKNAEHLKAVCQNFLRAITNSGHNVPRYAC